MATASRLLCCWERAKMGWDLVAIGMTKTKTHSTNTSTARSRAIDDDALLRRCGQSLMLLSLVCQPRTIGMHAAMHDFPIQGLFLLGLVFLRAYFS